MSLHTPCPHVSPLQVVLKLKDSTGVDWILGQHPEDSTQDIRQLAKQVRSQMSTHPVTLLIQDSWRSALDQNWPHHLSTRLHKVYWSTGLHVNRSVHWCGVALVAVVFFCSMSRGHARS
jgi:hypothetical protein